MLHDARLASNLAKIRLLVLDVDGTLTDGGIYLGESGEWKRFDVQDGAGIVFLLRAGLKVIVISGRTSACVERRCRELGVTELHQGAQEKLPVFTEALRRHGVTLEQTCVMGDDLPDLPLMTRAGVSVAPANATREVRIRAHVVTHAESGRGAARELAELLLRAQNKWHDVLAAYLD